VGLGPLVGLPESSTDLTGQKPRRLKSHSL
jgi:hypothetical protein